MNNFYLSTFWYFSVLWAYLNLFKLLIIKTTDEGVEIKACLQSLFVQNRYRRAGDICLSPPHPLGTSASHPITHWGHLPLTPSPTGDICLSPHHPLGTSASHPHTHWGHPPLTPTPTGDICLSPPHQLENKKDPLSLFEIKFCFCKTSRKLNSVFYFVVKFFLLQQEAVKFKNHMFGNFGLSI